LEKEVIKIADRMKAIENDNNVNILKD